MIGQWAKAAAALVLGSAIVVDLGLATAVLDHAPRDLPAAWTSLKALAGPGVRLAIAGRQAITGGAVAGVAAAAAGLLLGAAAATLSRPARVLLLTLLRVPAIAAVLLGLLACVLTMAASGPITAALAGFAVATAPLGARWTMAIVLLPGTAALVERAARRLDHAGFESLATLGVGPWRRLFTIAMPAVLPAAIKSAVAAFCVAACVLFVAAWPVPERHAAVAAMAATVPPRPLAALAFCAAVVLAVVSALLSRPPD